MNQVVRIDEAAKFEKVIEGEVLPPPPREPGIYTDLTNDEYHHGEGVSKSGLWTIYEKSPAHYKFPPAKDKTPQQQANLDLGSAIHAAILEPELFETEFVRGPADRRGNKWTDLVDAPDNAGKTILVESAYDKALAVRDNVHRDPWINAILTQGDGVSEASMYARDPKTGVLLRTRPDKWRRDLRVIIDVKTTLSARPDDFAKSVANYGYHSQEALYTDVPAILGVPIDAFIFIAFEKESPWATSVYELPPSIVDEGREIMRKAIDRYAECEKANHWPAYREGNSVQTLELKRWHYLETEAPDPAEEAA